MMNAPSETLWQHLVDAGVASGELPPAAPVQDPWYIRAMLGFAGWFGALFLLGFVGAAMAFVFRSESAALAVGLMCCVAAYAIFRTARDNDFLSQFGLALSFAGQVMFVFGLSKWFRADAASFALFVAAFEALLAFVLVNTVHRVWSSLAASFALSYALAKLGVFGMAPALIAAWLAAIWLHEPLWAQRGELWRPIGYGLALSLVNADAIPLLGHDMMWLGARAAPALPPWIGPLLTGALWVSVTFHLRGRHQVSASSRTGVATLIAVGAIAVAARDAPGVTAALLVMTLGYAVGARALLGIGVIALLVWLSRYYYSLQLTLLAKSGVLAVTGSVLIVLWFGIRLLFSPHAVEEKHHV